MSMHCVKIMFDVKYYVSYFFLHIQLQKIFKNVFKKCSFKTLFLLYGELGSDVTHICWFSTLVDSYVFSHQL